MSRLKAVLDPAPAAGRRARLTVLGVAALILGLAGGGAFAVAGQRNPQMVSADEAASLPVTARDTVWLNATLNPIYKAAWPGACGFGSTGDGAVFVQIGKGCTTDDVADPIIESIAFVDPSKSPRDAFAAVKAACDAGLEVPIRFRQAGVRAETSVRCAAPAVLPPEPTAFEVRLTWRGVTPLPGDRLVVSLERKVGETTFRRSLDFGLAGDTALPASVKAMVQPEFFQGQRSPAMKAALIGRDGRIRALSDEQELPMLVRDGEAVGYAELTSIRTPSSTSDGIPMWIALERGGERVAVGPGEKIVVQLTAENGMPLASFSNSLLDRTYVSQPVVGLKIARRYFPGLGQATRVYRLTGILYGADGSVISQAEPVTIRLASMSFWTAELHPTLTFPT